MLKRYLEQLFSDKTAASAPDAHVKHHPTVPTAQVKRNELRLKGIAMACLTACTLWLTAIVPPQAAPGLFTQTERPTVFKRATTTTPPEPSPPTPSPSLPATAAATATERATPAPTVPSSPTPSATATATVTAMPAPTPSQASPIALTTTASLITATDSVPTRLIIPAIHLEAPIIKVELMHYQVNGQAAATWAVPDYFTVGWHDSSALPGQGGNTVLNGHQDIYGAVFQNLDQLVNGDAILVYVGAIAYRYRVTEKHLVADEGQPIAVRARNVRWILPTADERLTLVTCAPAPHVDNRLIVVAHPAP